MNHDNSQFAEKDIVKETNLDQFFTIHHSSFIIPAKAQIYADRAPGRHSRHRHFGGDAAACAEQCEKVGTGIQLFQ